MRSTRRSRFSLVHLPGGRRALDRQIQPEDPLPPDRLPVPGQASHPTRGNGSREAPWARHRLGTTGPGAPEHIKANWPGSAWIVEVITGTLSRKGKRSVRRHLFLTSVRTTPQALLRLIRQRWSIENEWHWARDAQLGEDAHRYANRIGAPAFAFLRTIVMNLLRRGGYRSIRQGLRELAYDIQGMLALGGVARRGSLG
jgi:hypothetical protein